MMGWCTWVVLSIPAHQSKVRASWGEPTPETGASNTHFQPAVEEQREPKVLKTGVGEGTPPLSH